jgi:hypothetical protein
MDAAEPDAIELLVEPADLAVRAADLDVDAARDVLGGAAQVLLLTTEAPLEDIEVIAESLEREQRLIDVRDLRRDSPAQPLAGRQPAREVAGAIERAVADERDQLVTAACARDAIEQ